MIMRICQFITKTASYVNYQGITYLMLVKAIIGFEIKATQDKIVSNLFTVC